MNTKRTYGVEIECHSNKDRADIVSLINASTDPALRGHTARLAEYSHTVDAGGMTWLIKPDSSLRSPYRSHPYSFEVVSPILKGQAGLKAIKAICKILDPHCKVSRTCGLHVHHAIRSNENLKGLLIAWMLTEKEWLKMLPPSRKNNRYAKMLSTAHGHEWWRSVYSTVDLKDWWRTWGLNRYYTLNLESYWYRGTVEFRAHSGTISPQKINHWIISTQALVDRALVWNTQNFEGISFSRLVQLLTKPVRANNNKLRTTLPKPGTKTRLMAEMILAGYTKDEIVDRLDRRFGEDTKKNRNLLNAFLTHLRSNKPGGWGWRIAQVSNGAFMVRFPDPEDTVAQDDDITAAAEWMLNRFAQFQHANA